MYKSAKENIKFVSHKIYLNYLIVRNADIKIVNETASSALTYLMTLL